MESKSTNLFRRLLQRAEDEENAKQANLLLELARDIESGKFEVEDVTIDNEEQSFPDYESGFMCYRLTGKKRIRMTLVESKQAKEAVE